MKNKKTLNNFKAVIFDTENNILNIESVNNVVADQVETDLGVYDIKDSKRYVDDFNGKIYFVFNAPTIARVEAENLKKLRRSNALSRIFDYDVKSPLNIVSIMPWLIIIALIIFGG